MKDIIFFINESTEPFHYSIWFASNESDPFVKRYLKRYDSAKIYVQRLKKAGMIINIFEVPKENKDEFLKLSKKKTMSGDSYDKLKELSSKYFDKENIDKFLHLK